MKLPTGRNLTWALALLLAAPSVCSCWPQLLAIIGIGGAFFAAALARFRRTIGQMA